MTFTKDGSAVLDYTYDWRALTNGTGPSDWLESGETIDTYEIIPEAGITVGSDSKTDTDTSVTVWLSGGTAGNVYDVTCRITTTEGRTDDRTIRIQVRQR